MLDPAAILPAHVAVDLGVDPVGAWGGVPWASAVRAPLHLDGLVGAGVAIFHPGNRALLAVTDADCDTDGAGGSRQEDPDYLPHTSLRYPGGADCDSRRFPGVVMPPAYSQFGVRVGDFVLAFWRGAIRSGQIYDVGPKTKAGECSLFLLRGLGIVKPEMSNHDAARGRYPAVADLATLIFPGSGDGRAHDPAVIASRAHACWQSFTSRLPSS